MWHLTNLKKININFYENPNIFEQGFPQPQKYDLYQIYIVCNMIVLIIIDCKIELIIIIFRVLFEIINSINNYAIVYIESIRICM